MTVASFIDQRALELMSKREVAMSSRSRQASSTSDEHPASKPSWLLSQREAENAATKALAIEYATNANSLVNAVSTGIIRLRCTRSPPPPRPHQAIERHSPSTPHHHKGVDGRCVRRSSTRCLPSMAPKFVTGEEKFSTRWWKEAGTTHALLGRSSSSLVSRLRPFSTASDRDS